MGEAFLVRRVERPDLDRWLPLWNGYNEFYGRAGPTCLPVHVTDATWRRFFNADEPMHAIVAESQDELVGLAHYFFHPSTTSTAPACCLRDLFTWPSARGSGVATALIDRVREEARQAGSTAVYWHTHETNHVARKLYDKLAQRSGFLLYQASL